MISHVAATIQLSLASVTWIQLQEGTSVTFKFRQGCRIEECCRGQQCVSVNNCLLTIHNLTLHDSGHYACICGPDYYTLTLSVIVTRGEHFNPLTSGSVLSPTVN